VIRWWKSRRAKKAALAAARLKAEKAKLSTIIPMPVDGEAEVEMQQAKVIGLDHLRNRPRVRRR